MIYVETAFVMLTGYLLFILPNKVREHRHRRALALHWDWADDRLPCARRNPVNALGVKNDAEWKMYEIPTCIRWGGLGPVGKRLLRRHQALMASKKKAANEKLVARQMIRLGGVA